MGRIFQVDFTPPFKRVYMYDDLQKILGVQFPLPDDLETAGLFSIFVVIIYFKPSFSFFSFLSLMINFRGKRFLQ